MDSLSYSKKILQQYSSFIQKYLDIINTYYMSLTELNASFPMNIFSSNDNELDEQMKNISQLFLSFIQSQLNDLINFLSVTQSTLFALDKSISSLDEIIQNAEEKNKNNFKNIKNLNDNYHNQYLLMINSFENLENKIVKRYISNKYREKVEYHGNDDNIIKNCVSISKKLENSFINFKKDEMKEYLYEYNNNLENIIKNKIIYNSVFEDCIKSIINGLNSYYKNLINSIHKELSDFEEERLNIQENGNIYNKLKEKEMNSLIYNFFDTKKYNIKIIKNNVIKKDSKDSEWTTLNINDGNHGFKQNSKISLTDEDIYNIVKEIYDYDFVSINKEDYDLEIQKEKMKIHNLSKKLLSYDLKKDIKESITDDEVKTLYNFIKIEENNYENVIFFISDLYQFRAEGHFEMPKRVFDIINNILQNILDEMLNAKEEDDEKIKLISSIIMISFTYYITKNKEKYYLKEEIKDHKVFKSKEFWNDYTVSQIDEDLEKLEKNFDDNNKEKMKDKINNILLSKIFALNNIMKEFGMNKDDIIDTIENLMDKYQTDKKVQESFLTIIKQQM
jgi:hypothetical protein